MANFRVGQKVIVVRDGPSRFDGTPSKLRNGDVHVVTKVWNCRVWNWPCVLLADVEPPGTYAFDATRFRPVQERSTETGMAILKEILRTAKVPASSKKERAS